MPWPWMQCVVLAMKMLCMINEWSPPPGYSPRFNSVQNVNSAGVDRKHMEELFGGGEISSFVLVHYCLSPLAASINKPSFLSMLCTYLIN